MCMGGGNAPTPTGGNPLPAPAPLGPEGVQPVTVAPAKTSDTPVQAAPQVSKGTGLTIPTGN